MMKNKIFAVISGVFLILTSLIFICSNETHLPAPITDFIYFQVYKSDGTPGIATYTAPKKSETVTGTTNAAGLLTVNFANAYPDVPTIDVSMAPGSNRNEFVKVLSASSTGCVVQTYSMLPVLSGGILNTTFPDLGSKNVDVRVLEK